jgi:hypothetical protein
MSTYHSLPPQPLPENLWGNNWRFASFPADKIVSYFQNQPIPICVIDLENDPLSLGISSTNRISGIIIEGGRKSMILAHWLQENQPDFINYIPTQEGQSGGLVLTSNITHRWILATFEDAEIAQAAQQYETRKQENQGLHFLLVQPDDSGMTYSGFWLLKNNKYCLNMG